MTLDDLRRAAAGSVGLDPALLDSDEAARLDLAINTALQELATGYAWERYVARWTASTVAGTDYVLLPADFVRFDRALTVSFGAAQQLGGLCYMPLADLDTLRAYRTTTGIPEMFALGLLETSGAAAGRRHLELYPTPDGVYALTGVYRRNVTALAGGSDEADVDPSLGPALLSQVRCATLVEFNRSVPAELQLTLQRQVQQAIVAAGQANVSGRELSPVAGPDPLAGYPRGRIARLASDFPGGVGIPA